MTLTMSLSDLVYIAAQFGAVFQQSAFRLLLCFHGYLMAYQQTNQNFILVVIRFSPVPLCYLCRLRILRLFGSFRLRSMELDKHLSSKHKTSC